MTRLSFRGDEVLIAILCGSRVTIRFELLKLTVTAELNEQWIAERDTLIEALDSKVSEFLSEELAELHTDIDSFRDLETKLQYGKGSDVYIS